MEYTDSARPWQLPSAHEGSTRTMDGCKVEASLRLAPAPSQIRACVRRHGAAIRHDDFSFDQAGRGETVAFRKTSGRRPHLLKRLVVVHSAAGAGLRERPHAQRTRVFTPAP